MDWQTYEEITKNIYEILGKNAGVKIIGYGRDFKYTGKSGVTHQIDVLTSHSDGIHDYLTDIECKYCNKNVDKDDIMKVREIMQDCNFHKSVVVSKKGFTPDAKTYAKHYGIGLVILREPVEKDWEGRVKTITLEMNASIPHITNIDFKVIEVYKKVDEIVNRDQCVIILNDGSKKSINEYLNEFRNELHNETEPCEKKKNFDFTEPVVMEDINNEKIAKITGMIMSGRIEFIKTKSVIDAEDTVWLMMKSIFDEKTFTISKEYEIRDVSQ